jgi:NAD(P)-dependent dehydrogenase (short-subunit alcohol dehydrogenase family)
MPGSVAYAATKAALDVFTITFADEVGEYGITVNAVDPGPTDTGVDDSGKAARTALIFQRHATGALRTGSAFTRRSQKAYLVKIKSLYPPKRRTAISILTE